MKKRSMLEEREKPSAIQMQFLFMSQRCLKRHNYLFMPSTTVQYNAMFLVIFPAESKCSTVPVWDR